MRKWLAAAAALFFVGVGAPTASADLGLETRSYVVPARHGLVYLEVVHPVGADGKVVPAPTILTYSPYSVLGRNGDASRWVPRGYARAYADVVGAATRPAAGTTAGSARRRAATTSSSGSRRSRGRRGGWR